MRTVSLAYRRGKHTGPVVEVATALAFGMHPGLLQQQGIPAGVLSRARKLTTRWTDGAPPAIVSSTRSRPNKEKP